VRQQLLAIPERIYISNSRANPQALISSIINKEAYRKPQKASRKPPGRYKTFQGRNPEIILLVFWKKLSVHKDIIKLTDL
jgi:hypothetical protein